MYMLRKLTGCLSITTTTCDNDQVREDEQVDRREAEEANTSSTTKIFSQLSIFGKKIKENKVNTTRNIKQIINMSEG